MIFIKFYSAKKIKGKGLLGLQPAATRVEQNLGFYWPEIDKIGVKEILQYSDFYDFGFFLGVQEMKLLQKF
jgi:hypothetical protein